MDTKSIRERHTPEQTLYAQHNKTILALCDEIDRLNGCGADYNCCKHGRDSNGCSIGLFLGRECLAQTCPPCPACNGKGVKS